jgi:hypothetical protein
MIADTGSTFVTSVALVASTTGVVYERDARKGSGVQEGSLCCASVLSLGSEVMRGRRRGCCPWEAGFHGIQVWLPPGKAICGAVWG